MHRVTISLEEKLADQFDSYAQQRGYQNRSEAMRDLVRLAVSQHHVSANPTALCVANLSYIYNHNERSLAQRMMDLQHEHHGIVVSATHAHLDRDDCIETVILRGPTNAIRAFADEVCVERGVRFGSLNLVSVEEPLEDDASPPERTQNHLDEGLLQLSTATG